MMPPGATRFLGWLFVSASLGVAPGAQAVQLDVVLVPRPGGPVFSEAEIVLTRQQGEPLTARGQASPAAPSRTFELDEGVWSVKVTAPGLWSPEAKVILSKDNPRRVEVGLYEATAVHGRLTAEKGDPLPQEVGIELWPPLEAAVTGQPSPHARADALVFRCPVSEGEIRCPAPAGEWDVRVRAADHVSHYLWKVPFPKKAPASLGTLALKRGASVIGWVRIDGTVKPEHKCRLSLTPLQAAAASSAEMSNRVLAAEAEATDRGFFHFTGVSPGSYVLTARLEGFAAARFFPLRVFENRESSLEDTLVLKPPLSVPVRVEPARDLQERPWRIKVFDLGEVPGAMELATEGSAGEDGYWRAVDLAPGRFLFELRDASGEPWGFQEVELDEGSSEIAFELDFVELEGTLRIAGEPLAGALFFGGKSGVPSFRFQSDEEGRFRGVVTREGFWRVDVETKEPPVRRSLPRVEVERGERQVAKVIIDLPDGALEGRVVNERDQPEAGATVLVTLPGAAPVMVLTDGEGEFEFRGLEKGQAVVQARAKSQESESLWVQVTESPPDPPLRLVLKRKREVAGVVVGTYGGVPGAQVLAMAPGEIRAQAVTDVAGKFVLHVPASATQLDLHILPPGHSLQARRVSLEGGQELRLYVEPDGGTLILDELAGALGESKSAIVVSQNGVTLSYASLRHWAQANGQKATSGSSLIVPQVAPGQYELCRVAFAQMEARLRGVPTGHCVTGTLLPGGELSLRAPKEQTGDDLHR